MKVPNIGKNELDILVVAAALRSMATAELSSLLAP